MSASKRSAKLLVAQAAASIPRAAAAPRVGAQQEDTGGGHGTGHLGGHVGVHLGGQLGGHLGGGWHCCWFCWQDILAGTEWRWKKIEKF